MRQDHGPTWVFQEFTSGEIPLHFGTSISLDDIYELIEFGNEV